MACNSITLAALNASCDNSVGGIQVVYLIPYEYITGVTVNNAASASTAATYGMVTGFDYADTKSASDWVTFQFRKNTGSMTSTLNLDETNGVSYIETELQMTFSRMQTDKRIQMVALAQGEVAVIVKDSNGAYWFLGKDEGVTASAGSGQTGQQKTDGNFYQVTLLDASKEYPFEVSESLGDTIAAAAAKASPKSNA